MGNDHPWQRKYGTLWTVGGQVFSSILSTMEVAAFEHENHVGQRKEVLTPTAAQKLGRCHKIGAAPWEQCPFQPSFNAGAIPLQDRFS